MLHPGVNRESSIALSYLGYHPLRNLDDASAAVGNN
jgi:hypothetical protein